MLHLTDVLLPTYLSLGKTSGWSIESTERHSYSWYKNPCESDTRPLAQTTTLKSEKTEDKDSYDAWSAVVGLGARSTSLCTGPKDPPSTMWPSSSYASSTQGKTSTETHLAKLDRGDFYVPVEPSESEDHSQSLLRASNCRTYHRPNKGKQPGGADGSGSASGHSFGGVSQNSGPDGIGKTAASRGRTRDYTVLHPSCLSMFNVTFQDSMDRGMEEYTSSSPAADPGDAGRLKKKAETESKPVR